jgi:hypothetical protein
MEPDDDHLAHVLISTWTLITGRMLRSDVPLRDLSEQELIDFWADDHGLFQQEEPPLVTTKKRA